MVERPIKKSERQSQTNADNNTENIDSPVESNSKSSKPNNHRSSGNRKKSSFKDENKPPVNPALMRGPKPVKAQPITKTDSEPESEVVSEEPQE